MMYIIFIGLNILSAKPCGYWLLVYLPFCLDAKSNKKIKAV